jgi:hypothetical protein
LDEHTIAQCLKGARGAKGEKGSPRHPRKSSLKIANAPPLPDGRVVLIVDILDGQARFISQKPAEIDAAPPVKSAVPIAGGGLVEPPNKIAPGATVEGDLSPSRPEALAIPAGATNAEGAESTTTGVPAAR